MFDWFKSLVCFKDLELKFDASFFQVLHSLLLMLNIRKVGRLPEVYLLLWIDPFDQLRYF